MYLEMSLILALPPSSALTVSCMAIEKHMYDDLKRLGGDGGVNILFRSGPWLRGTWSPSPSSSLASAAEAANFRSSSIMSFSYVDLIVQKDTPGRVYVMFCSRIALSIVEGVATRGDGG